MIGLNPRRETGRPLPMSTSSCVFRRTYQKPCRAIESSNDIHCRSLNYWSYITVSEAIGPAFWGWLARIVRNVLVFAVGLIVGNCGIATLISAFCFLVSSFLLCSVSFIYWRRLWNNFT